MRLTSFIMLIFSFIISFPKYSYPAELFLQFGFVKIMRGPEVLIYTKSKSRVNLQFRDRVQTGSATTANILMRNGEESIKLGSRSFFSYDNQTEEQTEISLLTGKGQFSVTRKTSSDGNLKGRKKKIQFKVRTVTAIVGVRGTEFILGTSGSQTNLLTLSGSVAMASIDAPEIEVEVLENQAAQVQKGLAPTKPVTVPPELKEQIISEDSPAVFQAVDFPSALTIDQLKQEKQEQKEVEKSNDQEQKEDGYSDEEDVKTAPEKTVPETDNQLLPDLQDLVPLDDLQNQLEKTKQDMIPEATEKMLEIKIQRK